MRECLKAVRREAPQQGGRACSGVTVTETPAGQQDTLESLLHPPEAGAVGVYSGGEAEARAVQMLGRVRLFVTPWTVTPLVAQTVKCLTAMQETRVRSLGGEDPLEKKMATHSSILARKTPWTEEPGKLSSMGSQRVRHD